MYIFLSLLAIAVLLIANEIWWRRKSPHREHPRKIIHLLVGTFVAFWPYYLSWNDIRLISLAFLVVVVISKALNIFGSIHQIERFSVGEICFALAVGIVTFITKTDWIYAAAILQMSLADSLAAIVGVHYGHNNSYKVFNSKKSIAGSAAFLVCSLATLLIFRYAAGAQVELWIIIVASILALGVENLAVYGLDDLFLPVVVALILARP